MDTITGDSMIRVRVNQIWARWLCAGLLLGGLLATSTTAAAQGSEASFEEDPHVAFESLWVQSRSGRMVVNYEISDDDWKRLEKADAALWVTLYFPSEFDPPALEPTYTVQMDAQTGKAKFPRWLRPPDGDEVEMCISATQAGDNLGLRRGFLCDSLLNRQIEDREPGAGQAAATVQMTYRPGIPTYPLPGTLPDFNPPTPQGLPQVN
ncbi:MAG: hypothetical protein ACQEVA_04300 [Myxococcota bacterium]